MNILITGGAGFLGRRLARALLERGSLRGDDGQPAPIARITLLDVTAPDDLGDPRVTTVTGDIADPQILHDVMRDRVTAVFHLAAIVSAQAEADFDLGMRINVEGARLLLEACRATGRTPRVVFTSSVAVFGGVLPAVVQDTTAVNPQSSYGTQKAIAELLLADYSRKGFVDGRTLRLPTVSVRPGRPNKAASSFASGIIREPLNGETTVCPVAPDTRLWLSSPRAAVANLIAGHEIASERLGVGRAINLPGISVTVDEMVSALGRVAGPAAAGRIAWHRDPAIEQIVCGWPGAWDTTRANQLGLTGDADFDSIIRAYIEDDMPTTRR